MTDGIIGFCVPGIPRPKGSMKPYISKTTGRCGVKNDNKHTKAWQQSVAKVASVAMHGEPVTGPIEIVMMFTLPRPKSVPRSKRHDHTVRPDLDKLIRAILDALTGIVYIDDCQVISVRAVKRYDDLGSSAGVAVDIF